MFESGNNLSTCGIRLHTSTLLSGEVSCTGSPFILCCYRLVVFLSLECFFGSLESSSIMFMSGFRFLICGICSVSHLWIGKEIRVGISLVDVCLCSHCGV